LAVLINGFCVVVPVAAIERLLPEGVAAYLGVVQSGGASLAAAYADEFLTSASFACARSAEHFGDSIRRMLADQFIDRFVAVLDPSTALTSHPIWLDAARHPSHSTVVWKRGEAPGPVVGPSRPLIASAELEEFDLIELSRDATHVHWLDITTGRQLTSAIPSHTCIGDRK
jgi:hypothetical protein